MFDSSDWPVALAREVCVGDYVCNVRGQKPVIITDVRVAPDVEGRMLYEFDCVDPHTRQRYPPTTLRDSTLLYRWNPEPLDDDVVDLAASRLKELADACH